MMKRRGRSSESSSDDSSDSSSSESESSESRELRQKRISKRRYEGGNQTTPPKISEDIEMQSMDARNNNDGFRKHKKRSNNIFNSLEQPFRSSNDKYNRH